MPEWLNIEGQKPMNQSACLDTSRDTIRIALVDDFSIIRLGMESVLADYNHVTVVGSFASAEEAIDYLASTQPLPNVILMDLGLPGLNGIEATRQIKATHPDIRIVAFTSCEAEQDVLKMLQAGADGFCLKNIQPEQLVRVIEDIVKGSLWLAPEVSGVASKLFHPEDPSFSPGGKYPNSHTIHNAQVSLSPREVEVLKQLVEGKTNNQIAIDLYVSLPTIKSVISNIFLKLQVEDRVQAAVKAVKEGII